MRHLFACATLATLLVHCSLAVDVSGLTGGARPAIVPPVVSEDPVVDAGGSALEGGNIDGGDAAAVETDLRDVSRWTTFAMPQVGGEGLSQVGGYGGGLSVGDRLLLVPLKVGARFRSYDTRASLTEASSWTAFDLSTKDARATAFFGAVSDGNHVYLAPYSSALATRWQFGARGGDAAPDAFTDPSAYTLKDTGAPGMLTAGFDGKYVYYVPFYHPTEMRPLGRVVRYDTTQAFDLATAWTNTDLTLWSADAKNFVGAMFDGHFMYFAPAAFGVAARFDVTKAIDDRTAWTFFTTSTICETCTSYEGIAFDGRYAYLAPSARNEGGTFVAKSAALRFDTTADFASQASWQTFDMRNAHPSGAGYSGAVYDGRYVYYAPSNWLSSGVVLRFDSRGEFTDPTSWTAFDVATVNPRAYGYKGAVFDGKNVYFVPFSTEVLARFEARTEKRVVPETAASTY